jgi:CBS domain-containing protein
MTIAELCNQKVVTIHDFEELQAAAQLMREHHVGYLVVIEPHALGTTVKPVGVLTDRDIVVSVLAKGADPRALRVGDVMVRQPVTVDEDASLDFALRQMRKIGVRRIPIVGSTGQLLGVLSLDDVLDALSKELTSVVGSIRNELHREGAKRP